MTQKVLSLVLGAVLFAFCFPVWAQQPKKVPRIGYLAGVVTHLLPGLQSKHSGEDYETSVISREKTSSLSIATLKESWTACQALWPNSCNSM